MKAIVIAESYSSLVRIETAARRHGSLNYIITEAGDVLKVVPPHSGDNVSVMLIKGKNGERIFTPWELSYVVPTLKQLEALWKLVIETVAQFKMPLEFCGVDEANQRFAWGWCEQLTGVAGRSRLLVGQGGVFPEFYCLARFRGMSAEDARALTTQCAREGAGVTALPSEATRDVPTQNPRPPQRNGDQRQLGSRPAR